MKSSLKKMATLIAVMTCSTQVFALSFNASPTYDAKMKRAEKQYVKVREACDSLEGFKQEVCIAEAKAARVRQEADAKAEEENTPKARTDALIAHAQSKLDVAKVKCEPLEGNEENVCVKEAEVEYEKSVSIANANQTVRDAHEKAMENIIDADYELEREKCNSLSGDAKDQCVAKVKKSFDK